jgi:FKBP-type peptidyl-prolyl cis-trans isomerase SlyD
MQIATHTVATIDYTLTTDEGEVVDTSQGSEPLAYVHGVGGLVPGLEAALAGKRAGEMLRVRVEPAEGYGERDESLVARVPRTQLPGGAKLEVGMQFQARGPDGTQVVTLVKLDEQAAWLDANHPLAGMALNFAVTVVAVRAATPEELEHGHVHGAGGHHH